MGGVVTAVIGIVEIGVGAMLLETPFGAPLIGAGVSTLLGYAVSLLASPRRTPLLPIGAAYSGTMEPRRMIYGLLKVSCRGPQ